MAKVIDTASEDSRRRSATARRWKRGVADIGMDTYAGLTAVIASAVKQSRISPRRHSGLLRRFAPRNDDGVGIVPFSMALEIVKRFAAGLAAPEGLAGGRAEFGEKLRVLRAAWRTCDRLDAEQRPARARCAPLAGGSRRAPAPARSRARSCSSPGSRNRSA